MKNITLLFFTLLSLFTFGQTNSKHTYVQPYTRKDGTQVQGHYRTDKNNTNTDNFSTKGNTNPYTGQSGWIAPDNQTQYSSYPTTNYSSTYPNINTSYDNTNKYEGVINSLGEKVITYKDGQEVFGLCKICDNITYNEKLNYYWYTPYSGIQKTLGSSGGTLLNGEYKFYSTNGKLMVKANYNKGLENGDYMSWTEEGSIKEKIHYVNGVIDYAKFKNDEGYIVEWTGSLFEKGSIKKIFTSSKILEQKAIYIDNFKFNLIDYYPSGNIKQTCTMGIADFYYGPLVEYFENGKIKLQAFFNSEGFQIGEWKHFKEDGSLKYSYRFKYAEDKYENGNIKEKGSYIFSDGKWIKDGKWLQYDSDGQMTSTSEYSMGIEKAN